MNLMDFVQIAILLLLILLLFKPVYTRWLPQRWSNMLNRLLPARALKYEGTWQRKPSKTDAKH
jgi:Cellulose biosynthesis protein BcsF